jgi:hypothetical protein
MSIVWIAIVAVAVVVAGVFFVRSRQKGAFVERLPLEEGEQILLEEAGLKLFHRFRRVSGRGGGVVTYRVRAVLTDARILLATGGPEGKRKFVILMILDYTTPAVPVPETGYAAYQKKFRLDAGYPTYSFSAEDVRDGDEGGDPTLRIDVPFPERGPNWGDPPEIVLHTKQAERYREAVSRGRR